MEIFRQIMRAAVESGASDVHIKADAPVVFRVERQLINIETTTPTVDWINSVIQGLVPEHLLPQLEQDRELDIAVELAGIGRFRANVFQQKGSYVLALRVVKSKVRSFSDLNLPEIVRKLAETRNGIIIIAGAPGSGKSTTLASMVQHMNLTSRRHIITLEDPIEYLFDDQQSIIEQREIGLDTISFETGLRNVLRQDPDVLVIGEMRDSSSVRAAVAAANLGTLVITTLHTGDAARSIRRILDLFHSEEREHARRQIAGTLNAVICQKLVRNVQGAVVPVLEILINTAPVRKILEEDRLEKLGGTIEIGGGDGMQSFDQTLLTMVKAGLISQSEAFAHAPNPEGLRMKLQGVVLSESSRILNVRD
jgi:twitching motility protein PilT